MGSRRDTLTLDFGKNGRRPTALELAKFLKEKLRLEVSDLLVVENEWGTTRTMVKIKRERMETLAWEMESEFEYNDGRRGKVNISATAIGMRSVRLRNLPSEIPHQDVVDVLARYGEVQQVSSERYGERHPFAGLLSGTRFVKIILKKHVPSFVRVAGAEVHVEYYDQPVTCRICSETGHMAYECPANRRGRSYADRASGRSRQEDEEAKRKEEEKEREMLNEIERKRREELEREEEEGNPQLGNKEKEAEERRRLTAELRAFQRSLPELGRDDGGDSSKSNNSAEVADDTAGKSPEETAADTRSSPRVVSRQSSDGEEAMDAEAMFDTIMGEKSSDDANLASAEATPADETSPQLAGADVVPAAPIDGAKGAPSATAGRSSTLRPRPPRLDFSIAKSVSTVDWGAAGSPQLTGSKTAEASTTKTTSIKGSADTPRTANGKFGATLKQWALKEISSSKKNVSTIPKAIIKRQATSPAKKTGSVKKQQL